MVRCMGMKLLKSKSDYPRRTQYYWGRFVSCLHKLEAEGILDVEKKVDNRMRKYYKLTEAGRRKPLTDCGTGRLYQNASLVNQNRI
jgi:hypothetical protein